MSLQSFASSSTSFALRSLRIGAAPTLVRGKKDKKAPPKAAPTRQKGPPPDLGLGSSQNDIIKADLYPSSQPKRSPKPWASPRPDRAILLSKALPSPEAHETIDRATRLHKVSTANGRLAALKRKHALLFEACEELRLTSKVHYDLATQAPPGTLALDVPVLQAKGKFEGLFPREMRLPTETPGNKGWDYDWKFVPEKKAKEEIDFYS